MQQDLWAHTAPIIDTIDRVIVAPNITFSSEAVKKR
jgi:hypothetical protein